MTGPLLFKSVLITEGAIYSDFIDNFNFLTLQ